jgi:hypothetical protein
VLVLFLGGKLEKLLGPYYKDQSEISAVPVRSKWFSPCLRVSVVGVALPRRKGQQGDVACPLDGGSQSPLVRRAYASETARNDLASLGHKLAKQAYVLVVDIVYLLHAELADFLAAEKLAAAFAAGATGATVRTIRSIGTSHRALGWCCYFLIFVSHNSP